MSGGLALLRAFCSWKIEHYSKYVLFFLFHSFLVTKGVARQGQRGHVAAKFLAYLVILCFDRQCLEENTVARLKSMSLFPPKFLRWLVTLLHLSRARPCSSTSSLSHSTLLLGFQPSTDKKFTTTQDRQTLQNSDEKQ